MVNTACPALTYFKLSRFDSAAAIRNYYPASKLYRNYPNFSTKIYCVRRTLCLHSRLHIMTNHRIKYDSYWTNNLRGVMFTKYNYIENA